MALRASARASGASSAILDQFWIILHREITVYMVHWTCDRLNPESVFENPPMFGPLKMAAGPAHGLSSNQRPAFDPRDALDDSCLQ